MIFNIQKCSIHDGHGLRTLVFFKGCPLRCLWCANPESQSYEPEIMESQQKCIGCGACVRTCSEGAVSMQEDGLRIDRSKCVKCFMCAEVCYAGAKYKIGSEYTTEELFREIEKDRVFYEMKGGGVTFSGGEPLMHPEELTAIAQMCAERGIDVGIESCGVGSYEAFKSALPYINSAFMDIKHINSATHKKLTGAGNEVILENIKKIAEYGIPVTIRTPVIPGLNDDEENIGGIAEFLCGIDQIKEYELLPYHQFGINKYRALGRKYLLEDVEPPADEKMRALTGLAGDIFRQHGNGKICFYTRDNKKEIL